MYMSNPDIPLSPTLRRLSFSHALLLILTLCFIAPSHAASWAPIGPGSASVFSLTHSDANPQFMLAGTFFGGVYRSEDGGQHWAHVNSPFSRTTVFTANFAPGSTTTIYVGTFSQGLYKSSDGGLTWQQVTNGLDGTSVNALAFDPGQPTSMLVATDTGVFRSTDSGATWTNSYRGATPRALTFVPGQTGLVFLGTLQQGILRSIDSGQTWQAFSQGMNQVDVNSLTTDTNGSTVYAATNQGPFRLQVGQPAWEDLSYDLTTPVINQILQHPVDGRILTATNDGIFVLSPTGNGWSQWAAVPARTLLIANDGSITYVAATFSQLVATTDDGATFFPVATGIQNSFAGALLSVNNQGQSILYAGTDQGIQLTSPYFTNAQGETAWQTTSGFSRSVFSLAADPSTPSTLYAGTEHSGVWKSTDWGKTWGPSTDGIVPGTLFALSQSPVGNHTLYAATSAGLFISRDDGLNWQPETTHTLSKSVRAVLADPVLPGIAYTALTTGEFLRTVDDGQSFQPAATGLPANDPVKAIGSAAFGNRYAITESGKLYGSQDAAIWYAIALPDNIVATAIASDPVLPWRSYIATASQGVYRTTTAGITWQAANQGMAGLPFLFSLAVNPANGQELFAGTIGAIYFSNDGGDTWQSRGQGLPGGAYVTGLSIDPRTPSTLFASVKGHGVFRSDDAGLNWQSVATTTPFLGNDIPVAVSQNTASRVFVGSRYEGVQISSDNGATFQTNNNGMSLFVRSVAVAASQPGTLYAASLIDGMFRSDDAGLHWRSVGLRGRNLFDVQVSTSNPDLVIAATSRGAVRTTDGGNSWFDLGDQRSAFALSLSTDAANLDHFALGSVDGHVYNSLDGGKSWISTGGGLPNRNITATAIDPRDGTLYATPENGGLYTSHDQGVSWLAIDGIPATLIVNGIVVEPLSGRILAATSGQGVLSSDDAGKTWVSKGLSDRQQVLGLHLASGQPNTVLASTSAGPAISHDLGDHWLSIGQPSAFTFNVYSDPANRSAITVAGASGLLSRSLDQGRTWQVIGSGLPQGNLLAQDNDITRGLRYVAVERAGVFKSGDNGLNWTATDGAINAEQVVDLGVNPSTGTVFVATNGGGIFRSRDQGASWQQVALAGHIVTDIKFSTEIPLRMLASSDIGIAQSTDDGASWQWLGQQTIFAFDLVHDPRNPLHQYVAAASGELWYSQDGGHSWALVNGGLPKTNLLALTVAADGTLYVAAEADGLFRSQDDGLSWQRIGSGLAGLAAITDLSAGAATGDVYAASSQGLFISHDHGVSWQQRIAAFASPVLTSITSDPSRPGQLYVTSTSSTTSDPAVYVSQDDGQTWVAANNTAMTGQSYALAIAPSQAGLLFTAVGGELFRSSDYGQNWQSVGNTLAGMTVRALRVDASNPDLIFAGTDANGLQISRDGGLTWTAAIPGDNHTINSLDTGSAPGQWLAGSLGAGIIDSQDGGLTWQTGLLPGQINTFTLSLAVAPIGNAIYASIEKLGIVKSTDLGRHWTLINNGMPATDIDAVMVDATDPAIVYAASASLGPFYSHDGGASWAAAANASGLPRFSDFAPGQAAGEVYASTLGQGVLLSTDGGATWAGGYHAEISAGYILDFTMGPGATQTLLLSSENKGIYLSSDGGLTWQQSVSGLPASPIDDLMFANDAAPYVVIAGSRTQGLYRSLDNGISWQTAGAPYPDLAIRGLAIGAIQGHLIAASSNHGVLYSQDQGTTWTGGTAADTREPLITQVAMDPLNSQTIYAAASGQGLIKTTDGGSNWQVVGGGTIDPFILALVVDPVNPSIVYVGTGNGVFVSEDGGQTWSTLNDGLFNTNVTSLAFDPTNHQIVYVGTEGGGVFQIDRTPPPVDSDGDGIPDSADCAPNDPLLATLHTYYHDYDKDGFGGEYFPPATINGLETRLSICSLTPPSGLVVDSGDPWDFSEYQFLNVIDKLGRRFGVDITTLPESQRFNPDILIDLAPDATTLNLQWSEIETSPGSYDGTQISALRSTAALASSSGLAISLSVNPILGQYLTVPADLRTALRQGALPFNDPQVIDRFERLLDFIHAELAGIPLVSLQIGYEFDELIGDIKDGAFWLAYQDFYATIHDYAKTLWGADLLVAPTWTAQGYVNPDLQPLRQMLDPLSDIASLTYLPRHSDSTTLEPEETSNELGQLVQAALPKQIYFQNVAYPSAVITGSSTTKQSQFLYRFFRFWDAAYLNVPFVAFGSVYDQPPAAAVTTPQGATVARGAREIGYLGSLGLRDYPADGAAKPAFDTLRNLTYTRGWWRDIAQSSRDYLMGFTTATYDLPPDAASQLQAFNWLQSHLQTDSDITLLHFDGGVPWVEAYADDFSTVDPPYSPAVMDTLRHNRDTIPDGSRVAVSINPLGVPRQLLAPYWGVGEGFSFDANFNRIPDGVVADNEQRYPPAPWDTYDFSSPQVRQAYLNYCKRILDYFHPDYLIVGIEVSAALVQDQARYEQYFELHKFIYNSLKTDPKYAGVPIMVSFSATSYMIDEFGVAYKEDEQKPGVRAAQIDAFRRFMPYTDIIGLSLYPHFGKYNAFTQSASLYDEMFSLFQQVGAGDKPIAITESGFTADAYDILNGFVYTGSEEKQRRYYELLFRELARHSNPVEFVINFKIRDSDLAWQRQVDALTAGTPVGSANFVEFLKFFRDIGIYDGNGSLRSGGLLWQDQLALTYQPTIAPSNTVTLTSPDGRLTATFSHDLTDRLVYTLSNPSGILLETAPLGVTVDGQALGHNVTGLSLTPPSTIFDNVSHFGGHQLGLTEYTQSTLSAARSDVNAPKLLVELRLYNDGLAFRYQIPGNGLRLVTTEETQWGLPTGSRIWYQNDISGHQGIYGNQIVGAFDDYMSGAATVELPGNGFLTITEAGLEPYSALSLRTLAGATHRLQAVFPHDATGWTMNGGGYTPWRLALHANTLNDLINSDLIYSLNPPSDTLPQGAATAWLQPGKALWPGGTDPAAGFDYFRQREYITYAGVLGFRYVLLDPGWEIGFPYYGFADAFAALRALVDFAHAGGRNVDIIVWKNAFDLQDPVQREDFLTAVAAAGATGIRVGYDPAGTQAGRAFDDTLLRAAANHHLQIMFDQGAEPVGESRQYPNLMARAAVRGLAWPGGPAEVPPAHNTALPFTRQLSGPTDYKVVSLDPTGASATTLTHELAMSGLIVSPIQSWVAQPSLLASHSDWSELLIALPTVWDESIVLPGSRIGEAVAIARRSGQRWFIFAANGDALLSRSLGQTDLSFLGAVHYRAIVIGDDQNRAPIRIDIPDLAQGSPFSIDLLAGGGLVAMLTPLP